MKGFIRKVDKLGRICLPIDFRRQERLFADAEVEMVLTDDGLLLRKYDRTDNLVAAMGQLKRAIVEDDRIYEKLKDSYLEKLDLLEAAVYGAVGVEENEEDDIQDD